MINEIRYIIRNIVYSLFFIPELIIKQKSSLITYNISDLKYKYKLKNILIIMLISLIMLIEIFLEIFLNIYFFNGNNSILKDNFFFSYLFAFIISIILLKYDYYKHHYISIIIIIFIGLIKNIMKFLYNNVKLNSDFIIEIVLNILGNGFHCFLLSYYKIFMNKYYFSPYKIAYFFWIYKFDLCFNYIYCNIKYPLFK